MFNVFREIGQNRLLAVCDGHRFFGSETFSRGAVSCRLRSLDRCTDGDVNQLGYSIMLGLSIVQCCFYKISTELHGTSTRTLNSFIVV